MRLKAARWTSSYCFQMSLASRGGFAANALAAIKHAAHAKRRVFMAGLNQPTNTLGRHPGQRSHNDVLFASRTSQRFLACLLPRRIILRSAPVGIKKERGPK